MSVQTPIRTPRRTPTVSLDRWTVNRLQTPANLPYDVRSRDLYREFLRFPTLLCIPVAVALLSVVAMQSILIAVPCAVVLSTVMAFIALGRARGRLVSRLATKGLVGMVPAQRRAPGR